MDSKNNTGDYNTGNHNTGDYNTGNHNTGYRNTGCHNTGICNTGNHNTSDCNTGDYNTGNYNTGNHNTGICNTGNHNTGDCNTDSPKVRFFNENQEWEFFDEMHSKARNIINRHGKELCKWTSEINMSDKHKKDFEKTYKTIGGCLEISNEAKINELSKKEEDFIRSIKGFSEEILLQTTGIDLTKKKVKIIVDGKEILISREEFENIKNQFLK